MWKISVLKDCKPYFLGEEDRAFNVFGRNMSCLTQLLQVYYARKRKCFQGEEERGGWHSKEEIS
jgi:hypothetical protein